MYIYISLCSVPMSVNTCATCIHMQTHAYIYTHMRERMSIYVYKHTAQEWTNRTVAEHACSKM